jgi:glycerol-3-phosphate dehydrogenase
MWATGWRDSLWANLDQREWDLIVIGGGITGAGILREASRMGLSSVLFEAHDFASGTSSRSSKLVHGGLRYLKNAQIGLTSVSVHEREHLLKEGRGLITPLPFLMANFRDDHIPAWVFGIGLSVYDLLALKWNHAGYSPSGLRELCPQLTAPQLVSGFRYFDAQTDDARLVLRVLQEAVNGGTFALNYARVIGFLKSSSRKVCGVSICDLSPGAGERTLEVRGKVVINATGAWSDELRLQNSSRKRLRILRGSHLFFPWKKLPLSRAVTFLHPLDGRPVFVFPWEGVTLIGTTDVDHNSRLVTDVCISHEEMGYLLEAIHFAFPDMGLERGDVQSTMAGMRAVVDTGKINPSRESREFVLWKENGLLTVCGGKLTTFRVMAQKALRAVRPDLPGNPGIIQDHAVLDPIPPEDSLCDIPSENHLRLLGRYGKDACNLVACAQAGELGQVEDSLSLWAELRWAAREEGIVHLDDLLLRRVRLGTLLPGGGLGQLKRVRSIVQPELGWSDQRWLEEADAYQRLWQAYYAPV